MGERMRLLRLPRDWDEEGCEDVAGLRLAARRGSWSWRAAASWAPTALLGRVGLRVVWSWGRWRSDPNRTSRLDTQSEPLTPNPLPTRGFRANDAFISRQNTTTDVPRTPRQSTYAREGEGEGRELLERRTVPSRLLYKDTTTFKVSALEPLICLLYRNLPGTEGIFF